MVTHGSFCSGIGGFELAAEWVGWENLFATEIDEACQMVLRKRFPKIKIYEDGTIANFSEFKGRIDVFTGGVPCQPFSIAGHRKGRADIRNLFESMFRAIEEIAPNFIVAENVHGITNIENGLFLEMVYSRLENIGYQKPVVFDATSDAFGLPSMERHIWIIAQAAGQRLQRSKSKANPNRKSHGQFSGSDPRTQDRSDLSESRFVRVDQRLSNRVHRNRLIQLGNAIPPPAALKIFEVIQELIDQEVKV